MDFDGAFTYTHVTRYDKSDAFSQPITPMVRCCAQSRSSVPGPSLDRHISETLLTRPLPAQLEKDRMDIYHKLFDVARRGQLHTAPVSPSADPYNPTRIMDLGCGTGIWAIDMAE